MKTFLVSALFIAILGYVFTGSDFSQAKPEVFKNELGYYKLFTKNEKLVESALIWIDYWQSLEKERQLLASSKNEKVY